MNLKSLIIGLMFTSAVYAQTKFIKEYSINFLVDSTSKNASIENIVSETNNILEKVDRDDYGIRIKYAGVLDTLNSSDTTQAYKVLEDLKTNYKEKHALYLTKNLLIDPDKSSLLGLAYCPGRKLIVQQQEDDESTAKIFVHEFLHNLGVPHSNSFSNIFAYFSDYDLMSCTPLTFSGRVADRTKKEIWKRLDNCKFYDFVPVE